MPFKKFSRLRINIIHVQKTFQNLLLRFFLNKEKKEIKEPVVELE